MSKDETYYDLLKVDRRASVSEIASAYHTARNAFSKDSLAAYSLFSVEEAEDILKKLEEAYVTLSNSDRKREYDRLLSLRSLGGGHSVELAPSPAVPPAEALPKTGSAPTHAVAAPAEQTQASSHAEVLPPADGPINGAWLARAREAQGMSQEDVCRLTKIPSRALKAIETDDTPKLPARVYLQGFVSNLAKVYRLDPAATTKAYLENLDRLQAPPGLP